MVTSLIVTDMTGMRSASQGPFTSLKVLQDGQQLAGLAALSR